MSRTRYHYDGQGRIVREEKTILSVSYTTRYSYDPAGNLTAIADSVNPGSSKAYGYDGPWGHLAWTYDANGNRLAQAGGWVRSMDCG